MLSKLNLSVALEVWKIKEMRKEGIELAGDKEVTFKIVEQIGVIAAENNGWRRELNRVSWNGAAPKWDIRSWDKDHEKCSKGITLSNEEAAALKNLLSQFNFS